MDSIQKIIEHQFSDPSLLEMALTHASASQNKKSYERLEFLGDRVLSLAIAHVLYESYPAEEEGSLAKRHSALVKQDTLEKVAARIDLKNHIRVSSKDTVVTGSMLSDVIEAILAALYLDGGYSAAERFIKKYWHDYLFQDITPPEDGKSALQEWAQARGLPLPEYKIIEKSGPDHQPTFIVEVCLKDYPCYNGQGTSKQMAEKQAAQALLRHLRDIEA